MPNPTSQPAALNFGDAPGGDLTFDQLFPADGSAPTPTQTVPPPAPAGTTPAQSAPPQSTQQVAPPATQEDFLKGATSVYKTREAAIDGINQKDTIINQLRQRYVLATGIDPISNQPLAAQQPQAAQPNYAQDAKRYVTDLADAVNSGDPTKYRDVQTRLLFDVLEPIAPIISNAGREQAIRTVETEPATKEFRTFYGSPDYNAALDAFPRLKQAIVQSESDPRFQSDLPGYYKLAYNASQGMRLPALTQAAVQQTQPQVAQTTQTPRTTTPSSTPPPPSPAPPGSLDVRTSAGRKAYIAQMESQGILDKSF